MTQRLFIGLLAAGTIFALLAGSMAGGEPEPAPGGEGLLVVGEAIVEEVEVRYMESYPVQVSLDIRGVIGDGCTSLRDIRQSRAGNHITVKITTERPKDAVCTQIAEMFEERVLLDGPLAPGDYVVNVNDYQTTFEIQ